MQTYLGEFGNITLDVYDGEASVDTEVQIMDELINQKYDAIILQATDAAGLASSVDKAEAAGIPVITVNMDADTTHAGMVTMVDIEAGEKVAEAIGESLGGKGNVVIISATPGASKGCLLYTSGIDGILWFLRVPEAVYKMMRDYLMIIFAGIGATFLYRCV